jgi:hypothetical protein
LVKNLESDKGMTGPDDMISSDGERRIAELWAAFDDYGPADFRARVQALTAELPPAQAIALFELASANDATGVGFWSAQASLGPSG